MLRVQIGYNIYMNSANFYVVTIDGSAWCCTN